MNKVMLIGNVGKEPEVRYIDAGVCVASVRLVQTSTKICKYQVTTTFKMSIGYLQIFRVTSNEIRHKMC